MFYRFAKAVCRAVLLLLRRWSVKGKGNVPVQGGLVVISNHVSYWDPIAVGCALPRQINFMAKFELFKIPVLKQIITNLGAYPVRRGESDSSAIRTSLKILGSGGTIGIFPEGTRSKTGKLLEAHTGAVLLAIRARVPILPVAVIGTDKPLGKITVVIGSPITFTKSYNAKPERQELMDATAMVMGEVSRMMNSSCLGKR